MSYVGTHRKLRHVRGPAKQNACQHCGRQAEHWAYNHTDPMAITDPHGRVYSHDLARYIALCAQCHLTLDQDEEHVFKVAKVLDTPCRTCQAKPGQFCRSSSGVVYTSMGLLHARRRNDAPVDTRPRWMVKIQEGIDRSKSCVPTALGWPTST